MRASLLGLAGGLLLTAACGGGPVLRNATEVDLTLMVLQEEDLPPGVNPVGYCSDETVKPQAVSGDAYSKAFEIKNAAQSEACVLSVVGIEGSHTDALRRVTSLDLVYDDYERQMEESGGSLKQLDLRDLAEDRRGWAFDCRQCADPRQMFIIWFVSGNVAGELFLLTNDRTDIWENEAIGYALLQVERVEAVLSGGQS